MDILKFRKIYYIFSGVLALASILALVVWGLPFGIDFTGGSLFEIEFANQPLPKEEIEEIVKGIGILDATVQATGEKGYILRFPPIDEETHQKILTQLQERKEVKQKQFTSIGPVIGQELKKKAFTATWVLLIGILLYVAWAFRHARGFVSGWRYGFITLLTLLHDVLITVGAFAAMGLLFHYEANVAFIAALLLVLGYSVTDTVVVFDRIRENIIKRKESEFYPIVSRSTSQTIVRSLNTSFTALFVALTILIFGGETLKSFAATLAVGIAVGTYSSICLASPLLYSTHKLSFGLARKTIKKIKHR